MKTVNIHEAKTNFSRLVERVSKGESVVIAKAGKPMVKLVPLDEAERRPARRLGSMIGEFTTPDDFDRWGEEEIAELFYGRQ
jgi:prevent-host-death family protein